MPDISRKQACRTNHCFDNCEKTLVERWFAELTRKRLRRGVHTSVRQLQADIRAFIDRNNQNPKPFKWTRTADQILASIKRFRQKTQKTLCGEL